MANFSLKVAIMEAGNVLPRSQMSTSFLIFSYYAELGEFTSYKEPERKISQFFRIAKMSR